MTWISTCELQLRATFTAHQCGLANGECIAFADRDKNRSEPGISRAATESACSTIFIGRGKDDDLRRLSAE